MFAFDRHWQRMRSDAARMRVPFPAHAGMAGVPSLSLDRSESSSPSQPLNATLRVAVVRNRGGLYEGPGIRVISTSWRSRSTWSVAANRKLGVVPDGRHAANEFSGTKYISWAENLTRYERAHEQGLDEVILLNERGESPNALRPTCSWWMPPSRVWTPPLSSGGLAASPARYCWKRCRVWASTSAKRHCFRTT